MVEHLRSMVRAKPKTIFVTELLFVNPNQNKYMEIRLHIPAMAGILRDHCLPVCRRKNAARGFATKLIGTMKITFVLLTAAMLQVHANGISQTVSLRAKNMPLQKVFELVEAQTEYVVFTTKELMAGTHPVTANVSNVRLTDFLDLILKDQPVGFRIEGKTIMLIRKQLATAETRSVKEQAPVMARITGTITGPGNQPLAGATIRLKGKPVTILSDELGRFEINAEMGNILVITYVGYETKEVMITGNAPLTIQLSPASSSLDTSEVVYTGYQTLRRQRSTGAVTIITEKDLERKVTTNVLNMIEGMSPGLTLFKSGYGPENNEINIRGIASIKANREPLIIIDGFPADRMEMEDDPTLTGREDGGSFNSRFIAGGALALNPENIANITVLKDAAATAIYGARASNGVIVITTKTGKPGPAKVTYAGNFRFSPLPDLEYFNRLGSADFVDLQKELFDQNHTAWSTFSTSKTTVNKALMALYENKYNGMSDADLNTILDQLRRSNNGDQIKELMMRPYMGMQHNIMVSGGNNLHTYSVSASYNQEDQPDNKTGGRKFNLLIKERMTVKPWLILSGQVSISIAKETSNNSYADPVNAYSRYPGFEMLLNEDGSYQYWNRGWKSNYQDSLVLQGLKSERWNPYEEGQFINNSKVSDYTRLQLSAEGRLLEGLRYVARFSMDRSSTTDKLLQDENAYYPRLIMNSGTIRDNGVLKNVVPFGGLYNEVNAHGKPWTVNAQLDYNRNFGAHGINILAGFEARRSYTEEISLEVLGYKSKTKSWPLQNQQLGYTPGGLGSFTFYGWSPTVPHNWSRYVDNRWVSGYSNFSYAFQDRYILTGSMRIDQANLFGTDPRYRFKPLWSAGAKWNAKNEQFLANVKPVTELSVRASYGFNGNTSNASSPFLVLNTNNYETYTGNSLQYALITSPPNTRLRWEETRNVNVGVDYGFFKNRIRGSFDYYIKETRDMLGATDVDPTVGFSNVTKNFARMKNRGFEFSLNTINIDYRDFTWSTLINYSHNKNTVLENYNKHSLLSITTGNVFEAGYPGFAVFGVKWAGLDPNDGRARIYSNIDRRTGNNVADEVIKKDNAGSPTIYDVYFLGSKRPSTAVSVRNTFRYKNFTAEIFLVGNFGAVTRLDMPTPGYNNMVPDFANGFLKYRWSKPGDELITNIPSSTIYWGTAPSPQYYYSADVFTISADYVKVRELTLAYNIPKSLLKKAGLSSARLLVQGQNLFSFFANDYDIDPEAMYFFAGPGNRSLPAPKVFVFGVNLSF